MNKQFEGFGNTSPQFGAGNRETKSQKNGKIKTPISQLPSNTTEMSQIFSDGESTFIHSGGNYTIHSDGTTSVAVHTGE